METIGNALFLPQQGENSNRSHQEWVAFETQEDAEEMFVIVKERLLDINHWHAQMPVTGLSFQLVDQTGKVLHHKAHQGNFAVCNKEQDRRWFWIESIIYENFPDENRERMTIELLPVSGENMSAQTHFFISPSMILWSIERKEDTVIAGFEYCSTEQTIQETAQTPLKIESNLQSIFSEESVRELLKGLLREEA